MENADRCVWCVSTFRVVISSSEFEQTVFDLFFVQFSVLEREDGEHRRHPEASRQQPVQLAHRTLLRRRHRRRGRFESCHRPIQVRTRLVSGCGSVRRAVASDIRGPHFESSHRQFLY